MYICIILLPIIRYNIILLILKVCVVRTVTRTNTSAFLPNPMLSGKGLKGKELFIYYIGMFSLHPSV